MKSTASLSQQIEDLTRYLRTIRANVRCAGEELNTGFVRRARRPLENSLRWRRYRDAADLQLIAEACLHDLRKVQAVRFAPFSPGDQVIGTLTVKGIPPTTRRYAIWDIEPTPRELYCYQAIRITNAGDLSKRLRIQPLLPGRFLLRSCDEPLAGESAAALKWRREVCSTFVDRTVNIGTLDHFEIHEAGWMGHRSIKDRT
jgi:hypothetical protein